MKILFISYGYSPLDISKQADVTSEALSTYYLSTALKENHEITVLTTNSAVSDNIVQIPCSQVFQKIEEKLTGQHRQLKLDYFEFIMRAYEVVKKIGHEYDIIHQVSPKSFRYPSPIVNFEKPFILGPIGGSIPYPKGFDKIKKREPLIQKLRNTDKFRMRYDPFLVNTLKRSARILVTSTAAKKVLPDRYKNKTVVVPQGMFLESENTGGIQKARTVGEYVFSSGRLVPYKAMDLLIKAFSSAASTKNINLLITGDGSERARLNDMINELGMGARIKLLGKVSKKNNLELMRDAKFCVFTALNEAFGAVNLEAMAAGKPIIVTDWGGPADIVEEEGTGFKIKGGSIEEYVANLAEKIALLAANDDLCIQMGCKAKARIKERYTWNAIADKISKIYEEVT